MRDSYYTNEDIESVIADLENETENSMKVALRTVLYLLKDIRDDLDYENKPKVHTEPTDNPMDIIVGLNEQGVVSDQSLKDVQAEPHTNCNCPFCQSGK